MKASTNALKVRAESLVQVSKSGRIVSHFVTRGVDNSKQSEVRRAKRLCDFDEQMSSEPFRLSVESDGLCTTNGTANSP